MSKILNDFVIRMQSFSENKGYHFSKGCKGGIADIFSESFGLDKNRGISPAKLQLYTLSKQNKNYRFFIKTSSISPAFWGISDKWRLILEEKIKVVDPLDDWFVVLLKGAENGYLYRSNEFLNLMERLYVGGPSKNKEIKIIEKKCDSQYYFSSLENLFNKLEL